MFQFSFAQERTPSAIGSVEEMVSGLSEDNTSLYRELIAKEEENLVLRDQINKLQVQIQALEAYSGTMPQPEVQKCVSEDKSIGYQNLYKENQDLKNSIEQLKEENFKLEYKIKDISGQLRTCVNDCLSRPKIAPQLLSKKGLSPEKPYTTEERLLSAEKNTHFNLGISLAEKKEPDKAIEEFRKILDIDPFDKDAHFNLAVIYSQKQDYKMAIREYEEVLRLDPHDKEAYYNLALIYYNNLRNEDKAMEYYDKFSLELERKY
jgi:tetratricopeptide (TPR) repeat protein